MDAIDFPQANDNLGKPRDMTHAQCGSLPVYKTGRNNPLEPMGYTLSCWELSEEDISIVLATRKIWVHVIAGGVSQPPISLTTADPWGE